MCLPPLIGSFIHLGQFKAVIYRFCTNFFRFKKFKNAGIILQHRPLVVVLIKSGISCEIDIFNATMDLQLFISLCLLVRSSEKVLSTRTLPVWSTKFLNHTPSNIYDTQGRTYLTELKCPKADTTNAKIRNRTPLWTISIYICSSQLIHLNIILPFSSMSSDWMFAKFFSLRCD